MSAAGRWAAYTGSVIGAPVESVDEKFAQLPEAEQAAWEAVDSAVPSPSVPKAPDSLPKP